MGRKFVLVLTLLVLMPLFLRVGLNPTEVKTPNSYSVHNITAAQNYTTIQEAINNASDGDIIVADAGLYNEDVIVNRSVSLIGKERYNTIVNASGKYHAFDIKRNNVTIANFTIQNNNKDFFYGAYLRYPNGNISYNIVRNCSSGVFLDANSKNNFVAGNEIFSNGKRGIWVYNSSDNTIVGNNISSCGSEAILIRGTGAKDNVIQGNTISNCQKGIYVDLSNSNILSDNTMLNNQYNFGVMGTELSHFVNQIDTNNTVNGKPVYYWINQHSKTVPSDAGYIGLINSTGITIEGLNLKNNSQGVLMAFCDNCIMRNNTFAFNYWGAYIHSSDNVKIYHNNFTSNYIQAATNSVNAWDNGYPSGGNIWSDFLERYPNATDEKNGPYQNQTGSDGFWDNAYVIDDYNKDSYPIVPEFTSIIIMPLFIVTTLSTIIIYKRKQQRKQCFCW